MTSQERYEATIRVAWSFGQEHGKADPNGTWDKHKEYVLTMIPLTMAFLYGDPDRDSTPRGASA